MNRVFPLSVANVSSSSPAPDSLPDGILDVKRRVRTRLWFRGASAPMTVRPSTLATVAPAKSAENPQTDRLVAEGVQAAAGKTTVAEMAREVGAAPAGAPAALTDWRMVPSGAPVLLLSAEPLLGGGKPGPILGPGMRYRITSLAGSVVGVEVMHANGDTRSGFGNAVDMRFIELKIRTGELGSEKGLTGRLKLSKLASTTFGLFGG